MADVEALPDGDHAVRRLRELVEQLTTGDRDVAATFPHLTGPLWAMAGASR
jgi:hypothetical protein